MFELLTKKINVIVAVVTALTFICGAFVWSLKNHPVLKPELDAAIMRTQKYHDSDIKRLEIEQELKIKLMGAEMGAKVGEVLIKELYRDKRSSRPPTAAEDAAQINAIAEAIYEGKYETR